MRNQLLLFALLAVAVASCRDEAAQEPVAPAQNNGTAGADSTGPSDDAGASAAAVSEPEQLLHPLDVKAGWISLFDGQTLFGWQANNDPNAGGVNWRVEDGVITADEGEPGLLLTTVRWADFELICEYRLEAGGNSGIFLRTIFDPQDVTLDCYELNMCDTHPEYPTGSIVGRQKVEMQPAGEGEWQSYRVRVEGNQIVAKLDGRIVMDFVDESENRRDIGFIGLQKNEGKIEFRTVSLRPLGTTPLFDGESLDGWREVPGSDARFEPDEETIHVSGGPGFLETEGTWSDFVLQFEVRTGAKDVNSGLFFRAMPGTEQQPSGGYELQICNSFAEGDRSRPTDYGTGFGTGAIMHRAAARYIVADDLEWATLTLVADGPRFSTWVNGFPTTHWVDDRPSHENPREGLRLEPGHISLQAHDEQTDVRFRNLRIIDLSATNGEETDLPPADE